MTEDLLPSDTEPQHRDGINALASSPLGQIPIEITISVGRTHPLIGDLMGLRENSMLTLDRRIDDPVDLFIGNKLIAQGVLVEMDGEDSGQLAVRLTNVNDLMKI